MIPFENFNEIKNICQKFGITNYTINDDGSIDTPRAVDFTGQIVFTQHSFIGKFDHLPIKFRNVMGFLDMKGVGLLDLIGCPISVGGYFRCSENKLISLEGCPKTCCMFDCSSNQLTSLKYGPMTINQIYDYRCHNNKLESLEYLPDMVGNLFINNNN